MTDVDSWPRPVKRVEVSMSVFKFMLAEGNLTRVVKGLPRDPPAELIHSHFDPERHTLHLLFEHPAWEPIREAEEIPVLRCEFEDIDPNTVDL